MAEACTFETLLLPMDPARRHAIYPALSVHTLVLDPVRLHPEAARFALPVTLCLTVLTICEEKCENRPRDVTLVNSQLQNVYITHPEYGDKGSSLILRPKLTFPDPPKTILPLYHSATF